MKVKNKRISFDEFLKRRKQVLSMWPNDCGLDLDEAVEYHKRMANTKNASLRIQEARNQGRTLIEARGGFALLDDMISLNRCLEKDGFVDLLPSSIDTLTRNNQFEDAARGAEESIKEGRSMINGYPIVYYGVEKTRSLIEAVDTATLVRATGVDNRLIWEIALASGYSGGPGNGLSYYGSGCKNDSLEEILLNYQYIDRLAGLYTQRGVPIYRESHGVNIRAIIPPSLFSAFSILTSILAAEQGVKHIGPCSQINGELFQDVATISVLARLTEHYLRLFGHRDVHIYKVLNSWGGHFPLDEAEAYAVICYSASVAALAGVDVLITKSTQEAHGVPTGENNAAGARAARLTIDLFRGRTLPRTKKLKEESEIIERETKAIVNKVIEMGDGEVMNGIELAFRTGVLDAAFSPNINFADKVMPARAIDGAVRYLNCGNLPFDEQIVEFNQGKLRERSRAEGKENVDYKMMIDDVSGGLIPSVFLKLKATN